MKLHHKKDLIELENELGPVIISIPGEDEESYFDGYAMVYDCIIVPHNALEDEYSGTITHEVLCFHLYGEEE